MIIIKIHNFSDGIHELNFNEPVKNLGLEEPFYDSVLCKILMDKSTSQIVINCELAVNAKLICDRCGAEFKRELKNNFQNVYIFSNQPEETESENLIYLSREADKINLTDDIRDYAILSVPMKILCDEDCKGLCYKCGANLNYESCSCEKTQNENSVWSALEKIKNKLGN